jgi:hypothetical protein
MMVSERNKQQERQWRIKRGLIKKYLETRLAHADLVKSSNIAVERFSDL